MAEFSYRADTPREADPAESTTTYPTGPVPPMGIPPRGASILDELGLSDPAATRHTSDLLSAPSAAPAFPLGPRLPPVPATVNRWPPADVLGPPTGREPAEPTPADALGPPAGREPAQPIPADALGPLPRQRPADVPAAEDPRIFELPDMLAQDRLRDRGLEVESRPRRAYRIRWPGSQRDSEIRPEYHGVAFLKAATHAHGQIRTSGLGLMFPPHTVHARNSTSVVVGNHCELTQVDHVHTRKAVVAQDDALRSAQVRTILARAKPGQDNSGVVRDLRSALAERVERPAEAGPTSTEQRVRADCVTSIHEAKTVQLGDGCTTQLDTHFVVERTTIPAGALLADSEDLARRYVEIVVDRRSDAGVLADFLVDLVGAADNATDDNVLGYADGLPEQRATVLGLFGLATVNHATSVMVGVGNELRTDRKVGVAPIRADRTIARGVEEHRAARPADRDGGEQ